MQALCHSKQSESVGSRFAESNAGNHAVAGMHVGIMPRRMVVPGRSRRLTPRPIVDHDIEDSRLAALIAKFMHAIRRKEQRISGSDVEAPSVDDHGKRPLMHDEKLLHARMVRGKLDGLARWQHVEGQIYRAVLEQRRKRTAFEAGSGVVIDRLALPAMQPGLARMESPQELRQADLQCRGKLAQHRGSGNRSATFDLGDHRAAHARQRPEPIEGELRLQAQTSKIGRERFGAERVLGGLCHIGVALGPAGEIQHLNTLQRLALGARTHSQQDAAQALHGLMERGGFAPVLSQDILQEMWEKFVFLTTYAGMTTLMRAPVGAIVQAQDGEALVRQMLGECVATAAASGYIPSQDAYARMFTTLSERGSTGTASMLRDLQRGGPTEHEHIIGDMLRRAHEARLDAPLLRVSLAHMQAYEATRMAHGGG